MAFAAQEMAFELGLYANRSKRASKGRWVDGNLVRFRDGVPAQIGGWRAAPLVGDAIQGRAREMISWRPNSLVGRYSAIGTHSNAYQFDGSSVSDITPASFTAGRMDSIVGAGFGAGPFGAGLFGTPRVTSSQTLEASSWTFDMFGETLLGCFNTSGVIYKYLVGTDASFVTLTNAPTARAIVVSDERHVFALGANGNPRLVMWSDRENSTVWTPAAGNRAGSYEMQARSAFQCGKRARGQVLAWTQTEMFAFTPLNNSLVYRRDRLGDNCGAISSRAAVIVSNDQSEAAYWMGFHNFFVYDGLVRPLSCELWDYVFKDINVLQAAKTHARFNSLFGEVWFFYCSASSMEIDRAVVYSVENQSWTKAAISRLAWLDAGIFNLPFAIDADNIIYEHENGTTANGVAMDSYVVSHPMVIGAGQQFAEIAEFWPDMEDGSGTCSVSFICRDYPGASDQVFGPYQFTPADEKIDLAISTKQFQLKVAGVAGSWELGLPLISVQGGGLRQ